MHRYLRAGSRWRRPCGNFSIPGDPTIDNRSREVRPSIPSGSAFNPLHLHTSRFLSLARSPRFEGSANKLVHQEISIFLRDAGNLGIWSKLSQEDICNVSSWGSGKISSSSDDEPVPSSLEQYEILRRRRRGKHRSSSTGQRTILEQSSISNSSTSTKQSRSPSCNLDLLNTDTKPPSPSSHKRRRVSRGL